MSKHTTQIGVSTPVANPPIEYFGALDGFRGSLAIVVAVYHTIWLSNVNSYLDDAQILVDLFFVLSGFLMFFLYRGRLSTRAQGLTFLRRRFARIYPLHFFTLLLFVLYQFARVLAHVVGLADMEEGEILPFQPEAAETMSTFFANLTLTHSMGILDGLTYNVPSWTVSVEFYTYFVFLAMMMFCPPRKTVHFAFMALCVAGLYYLLSTLKPNMDVHYDYGFLRCLGGFFSGVLAAWIYGLIKPEVRNGSVTLWGSVLEVLAVIGLIAFMFICTGKLQFFFGPLALMFVLIFAIGRGFVSKVMSRPFMLYLGKISYSIYLVHMLISVTYSILPRKILPKILGPDWNISGVGGDLLLIPYVVMVVVASHFTYIYVERAGQKAILAYQLPKGVSRVLKRWTRA